ncbi:MAG: response regulator transcription factor [Clostridia bacterium]|nr:response regulator transcription factor [Clostridia bacterium]
MKKVLVAEDESSIREFIVINLQRSGYDVLQAKNGEEALKLYEEHGDEIDIALLDIMMPIVDGIEVCKQLRSKSRNIGIIILTAKTQEMDKVTGLLVGADDYVTKPFSPSELMARVDALYRRVEAIGKPSSKEKEGVINSGEFSLNIKNRTFFKNNKPIELTHVEFSIMEYFFENKGVALSRSAILNKVWGEKYLGEEKVVDVNVRRLRMKIEEESSNPQHLVTIWGYGYKWMA